MTDIFLIRCLYNGTEYFCIWYSDDKDGLFCDENKRILGFSDKNSAALYLSRKSLSLSQDDDSAVYDFDSLRSWADSDDSAVNCYDTLNFWNIFTDIAYSGGKEFEGDKRTQLIHLIYEKLFFGNNLPSVKPKNEPDYVPVWTKKQVRIIKTVMKDGLNIFGETICSASVM